jgi:hypothetical protein
MWSQLRTGAEIDPLVVTAWEGDAVPPTVDPPGYPEPDRPVPFFDDDEGLPVGAERRYAWPLGDCGGMWIDAISWVPAVEPDMTDWPIRDVEIDDGPTSFAYGRVTRLAEDAIEFSVEGTDTNVTLTPQTEAPEFSCA